MKTKTLLIRVPSMNFVITDWILGLAVSEAKNTKCLGDIEQAYTKQERTL